MIDLFHPIKAGFVEYEDEYVEWLEEGNTIRYQTGSDLYVLKKIPEENVLFIHGVGNAPISLEEEIPELEADEPDEWLSVQYEEVDANDRNNGLE